VASKFFYDIWAIKSIERWVTCSKPLETVYNETVRNINFTYNEYFSENY